MSVDQEPKPSSGFPYLTVLATLATLFLFAGLVVIAYRSPNYLGESTSDPKVDPGTKLHDVKARNQAVLDGQDPGVKMSVGDAATQLAADAETRKDTKDPRGSLPFPVEPKAKDAKDKK
jgi:hypothetical protein